MISYLSASMGTIWRWKGFLFATSALLMAAPVLSHAEHSQGNYVGSFVVDGIAPYVMQTPVTGRMAITGSDTMQPILSKLANEFRRRHPDMKIAVQGSAASKLAPEELFVTGLSTMRRGDGDTAGHLGAYDVRILASSRALTDEELQKFTSRYGYSPLPIPIAQDGIAIYVNKDNPVQGLALDQIDAMFSETRKRGLPDISQWGQLGLEAPWEQAPIHLFGRDQRSTGTLPFFRNVVLQDGQFKKDVSPQPGSASVVMAVGKDIYGIGYSGIGFQTSSVRAVGLAAKQGQPYIVPTVESVMRGEYPLSRLLYLYVNKDPKKEWDAKTLEFLRFINSRDGQETITRAGVYPLTSQQIERNLASLQKEILRAAVR